MENNSIACCWQIILLVILAITLIPAQISARKSKKTKQNFKQLPQPKGALPFIGHLHLLGGKRTIARTLGAMADECGPSFGLRLGQQQAVVLNSKEVVQDCFVKNDAVTATRPTMAVSKYFAYNYACFAISPHGKYWRDIRKISTVELLSTKRLEKMKHVRASEVNSCIKNLFRKCTTLNNSSLQTGKISLCKWFEYTSFNIVISMIVGKTFSPELYDENGTFASRFKNLIGKATYVAGVAVPSDFIPYIEWMDVMGYIRDMKDIHKEIDMIIGHWLDEHILRRKEHEGSFEDGDFMDVMLSNLVEGCDMSGYTRETVIKATALILLLTGSESTSITLTWAISLLLNHPKALKAAQEELDQQVGKQRWVNESDIANLPYLQAIIKETLRLYPPSPLAGPREALEDCHIDNHFIRKGTRIIVNIWKVHRDPRVWAGPDEFRPERFLNEHGSIDFRGQSFEYIPFSLGRRACPGMNFGLQVVQLMLGQLIQGFDMWTEDGGPVDMSEGLGLAMPRATPLNAILAARLPVELYDDL
ncbi:dimethylnonatriene synthase [Beta vulgaris subsp. vulgaris]|uniref:dimethylnonatriene synthase n=1 Tax=Beta vulgaris subsp. vulgaris TaxID=3555 RepID=UPI0020373D9E|nr:dimethylnonatriene synthase [Beta vulgaris subsp. vulgaris]